jgi:hypothetical protein
MGSSSTSHRERTHRDGDTRSLDRLTPNFKTRNEIREQARSERSRFDRLQHARLTWINAHERIRAQKAHAALRPRGGCHGLQGNSCLS